MTGEKETLVKERTQKDVKPNVAEKEKSTEQRENVLNTQAYHSRADALDQVANIQLDEYDFSKLPIDASIFIFGKRRYGKTIFAEYVLWNMQNYFKRGGYVFTKTKQNYFWQKHFPENRVYDGVQEEVLLAILEQQRHLYHAIMNGAKLDVLPHICIVFEDCISEQTLKKSKILETLIFNGRHYFIFVIICSQDVKGIGPALRQNGDLVALTYQTQERSVESIRDDYAYFFDNRYGFNYLLTQNTTDHQLLLIDQAEAKYSIEDVFKIAKAPNPKENPLEYKIGNREFWIKSGNIWKQQLDKAKFIPCSGREDWEKEVPDCKFPEPEKDPQDEAFEKTKQNFSYPYEDSKLSQIAQEFTAIPSAEKYSKSDVMKPRSELEKVLEDIEGLTQYHRMLSSQWGPQNIAAHGSSRFWNNPAATFVDFANLR